MPDVNQIDIPDKKDFEKQINGCQNYSEVQKVLNTAARFLPQDEFEWLRGIAHQRLCAVNYQHVGHKKGRW